MTENNDHKSWWHTLPGILTAIATLITAIAGLIAILQTHRLPSPGLELAGTTTTESKPAAVIKEAAKEDIKNFIFNGNVGKLPAVFDLTFNFTQQKIHGSYYYPARKGIVYTITGIIQNDHIELTEFTSGEKTATCRLVKAAEGCYTGKMYNTDGRQLQMQFCQ